MNCKLYCLGISIFSVFFLSYLFIIVAIDSPTLYIEIKPEHRSGSAFALFISVIVYCGICGCLYYNLYLNFDRKELMRRWISERKHATQTKIKDYKEGEVEARELSNFN